MKHGYGDQFDAAITRMYESDLGFGTIAKALRVSPAFVRSRVLANGLAIHPDGRLWSFSERRRREVLHLTAALNAKKTREESTFEQVGAPAKRVLADLDRRRQRDA